MEHLLAFVVLLQASQTPPALGARAGQAPSPSTSEPAAAQSPAAAAASATRPGPGAEAPAFALPASTGATVRLADFKGKKTVVLAFFPKAFTGG
jgi:hypothetical protein